MSASVQYLRQLSAVVANSRGNAESVAFMTDLQAKVQLAYSGIGGSARH